MNIFEAMTLAKEKPGVRIRPKLWESGSVTYDTTIDGLVTLDAMDEIEDDGVHLYYLEDFLGEWEVA